MDNRYLNNLARNKDLWDTFICKQDRYQPDSKYKGSNPQSLKAPKVSDYLANCGYRVSYPEGKTFAICLTHDIDDIYPPLTHKVLGSLYCLKDLNFRQMRNFLFFTRRKQSSPYINFQQIIDLERRYSAKSTFYFMATDRDPRRFRYNIEEIAVELKEIQNQGWEVGLHGGYYSYNDHAAIKIEKKRLEQALGAEVLGYRNHYLRFDIPRTWDYLIRCGFKYDSTLGFTNVVGFRNGMCHPFKPVDIGSGKQLEIVEIPLHIMDGVLFDKKRNMDETWNILRELVDRAEKVNGVLTVLWHNSAFNCPFRTRWQELYEQLLEYGSKKNAWMTSQYELWRWWQSNGYQAY